MPRVLLITNPAAARTDPDEVVIARAEFAAAGWEVDLRTTVGPGDAERLAAEGVAAGVERVAIFGGDGTAMEAAAALLGTDVPLGLIPGGTGNLLAGNLRIPGATARAARTIVAGRARAIDVGRVELGGMTRHFAVACGAGIDAEIMAATTAVEKRRWGMAAYAATALRLLGDVRNAAHRIEVDGVAWEAEAAIVLVCNCAEVIPPLVRLHEAIQPDDGVLDVVILRADSLVEGLQAVWELLAQEAPPGARVAWARGREIRVASHPARPVELDGDLVGETPLHCAVVPGALRVMVPPDA